jgi:hypothetical protein
MQELSDFALPYGVTGDLSAGKACIHARFLEGDLNEAARAADATRACCQPDCLNQGIVGS